MPSQEITRAANAFALPPTVAPTPTTAIAMAADDDASSALAATGGGGESLPEKAHCQAAA